ncbi:MAG: chromate resistance protein ChrB domain-containing protein [Gemmatimonadaceae bacterium]
MIPQLPAKPDYLRVKLQRRLQRIGAMGLKSSVYILPHRPETVEDFEWLRAEIVEDGGDAILWAAIPLAGETDEGLEALFRQARDADYKEVAMLAQAMSGNRPQDGQRSGSLEREIAKLHRRLGEIGKIDFFAASGRHAAQRALENLSTRERPAEIADTTRARGAARASSAGKTWVTREGVFVDRIACAWLIRRFIDPLATFKFVPPARYSPRPGEVRFDMYQAEYTNQGDRCSFETLLQRFGIDDPALRAVGEVVHDIDCKDEKFDRPESSGVESILAGLVKAQSQALRRLELGGAIFDALYAQLQ